MTLARHPSAFPLRVFSVFSRRRELDGRREQRPLPRRGLVKPVSSVSGVFGFAEPQAPRHASGWRHSRGTPGCYLRVTVRSTERDISITGGLILVLQSRPCSSACTCRRVVSSYPVYSVRSARVFASGLLQPAIAGRISAFSYTSALSTCDWTCSLNGPFLKCHP